MKAWDKTVSKSVSNEQHDQAEIEELDQLLSKELTIPPDFHRAFSEMLNPAGFLSVRGKMSGICVYIGMCVYVSKVERKRIELSGWTLVC